MGSQSGTSAGVISVLRTGGVWLCMWNCRFRRSQEEPWTLKAPTMPECVFLFQTCSMITDQTPAPQLQAWPGQMLKAWLRLHKSLLSMLASRPPAFKATLHAPGGW